MKQKQTHRHGEQSCDCQGGGAGGMDWEFEINRYKLLYREQTSNKILLCSAGNCIQYPVTNDNRKEYERGCVSLNHFAILQKLTQHCKSIILK